MRLRLLAAAASAVLAGGLLLAPSDADVSDRAPCSVVHESSADVASHTSTIAVTRSSAHVVRRAGNRVTAAATDRVDARADVVADGTGTVDLCPDGVSTPYTRRASRHGSGRAAAAATRSATRSGATAAKAAAKAAARQAAAVRAAPTAYQRGRSEAIDAASQAALAAAEAAAEAGGNPTPGVRWSVGYYAGYESADYPVTAIDWDGLTDVAVAFYLVSNRGALDPTLFQGSRGEGDALARDVTAAAHSHGKRALASIGGADSGPALRAAMTNHRAALVQAIVALRALGYDGVDIDWEPATAGDLRLIAQLGTAIHQAWPSAVLTSTFYSVNVNFPPDLSGMRGVADVYDFISVQTYGMAGAYQGWRSWHSSALDGEKDSTPTSVESSARAYLDAGVPASKLGMGVGAYGLCYTAPVTAPSQELNGSRIAKADYDLQFRRIRTTYQPAMTRHFDATAQAPYLSGDKNGCTYISYEDEQSVEAKLGYLQDAGLGGVIVWTINQQYLPDAPQTNPLLDVVATAWLGAA